MAVFYKFLPLVFVFFAAFKWIEVEEPKTSLAPTSSTAAVEPAVLSLEAQTLEAYENLDVKTFAAPPLESFKKAMKGFVKMKSQGLLKKEILTIIDFSLSSTQRRMWIIDMAKQEVLLQTVVSHGQNSGAEFANKFSNQVNSYQSSLGFYKTGESYTGKNGFSMRLDGLEKGFNDNARPRAVVVHGADYASEALAKKQGRLGRSQGCPAVPLELRNRVIELIKDESCLFIYYPSVDYLSRSTFLA